MGLLRVGPPQLGRLRFGPWRGDARVACIAPTRLAFGPVSAADVRDCVERAGHAGYDQVLTAALGRRDQPPFLGGEAQALRVELDGRAVGVVGADVDRVLAEPL